MNKNKLVKAMLYSLRLKFNSSFTKSRSQRLQLRISLLLSRDTQPRLKLTRETAEEIFCVFIKIIEIKQNAARRSSLEHN